MWIKHALAFVIGLALGVIFTLAISEASLPSRLRAAESETAKARDEARNALDDKAVLQGRLDEQAGTTKRASNASRGLVSQALSLKAVCVNLLDILGWQRNSDGEWEYNGETTVDGKAVDSPKLTLEIRRNVEDQISRLKKAL